MKKKSLASTVFMFLVLAALIYLWFPRKSHQVLWTDKTFGNAFRPVQEFFLDISTTMLQSYDRYVGLQAAVTQNEALRRQVAKLTVELAHLQNQNLERSVAETLQSKSFVLDKAILPVRILSDDPFVPTKSVMIDAGAENGVELNAVVVAPDGLVGRVLKVFPKTSQVLLLTDPHFRVDAMSQANQNRIIVRGVDSDLLWGKGFPVLTQSEFLLHEQAFQNGEELVTSGFGGIYPANIPVGKIVDIKAKSTGLFSEADILPAVDFSRMQYLFVLRKAAN